MFKAVKNHKSSGYGDCQQVGSIDQNLIFSKPTIDAYMYANEQLGPCFYVLHVVRFSLLFGSEIILKQLFASGSVNIVE